MRVDCPNAKTSSGAKQGADNGGKAAGKGASKGADKGGKGGKGKGGKGSRAPKDGAKDLDCFVCGEKVRHIIPPSRAAPLPVIVSLGCHPW